MTAEVRTLRLLFTPNGIRHGSEPHGLRFEIQPGSDKRPDVDRDCAVRRCRFHCVHEHGLSCGDSGHCRDEAPHGCSAGVSRKTTYPPVAAGCDHLEMQRCSGITAPADRRLAESRSPGWRRPFASGRNNPCLALLFPPEIDIRMLFGGLAPAEHAGQSSFNFRCAQQRWSPG